MNISVAVACDIDKDGDLDLFVGGRSVPQNYGVIPDSYFYSNDGHGKFSAAATVKIGMVTDAVFADITGDKQKELVVVGEWMSPKIFSFTGNKPVEIKTNLSGLNGWWQSVAAADLDGDGDNDIVLGNTGENCYLKPDVEKPVRLWISDFDQNGTLDKIITRTVDKKDVPVFLKRELTEQMPSLKKQNLRFSEYAKKSIQDLFSKEVVTKAAVYEFNYCASCIATNQGGGKFDIDKLPVNAELSSVNAILCTDINKDGRTDLLMGGNQFYFQPQFSRLDASFGDLLLNKGNNQWDWVMPARSGFELRGEIKKIISLPSLSGDKILVLQNDELPVLYQVKEINRKKL